MFACTYMYFRNIKENQTQLFVSHTCNSRRNASGKALIFAIVFTFICITDHSLHIFALKHLLETHGIKLAIAFERKKCTLK